MKVEEDEMFGITTSLLLYLYKHLKTPFYVTKIFYRHILTVFIMQFYNQNHGFTANKCLFRVNIFITRMFLKRSVLSNLFLYRS